MLVINYAGLKVSGGENEYKMHNTSFLVHVGLKISSANRWVLYSSDDCFRKI